MVDWLDCFGGWLTGWLVLVVDWLVGVFVVGGWLTGWLVLVVG